MPSPTEGVVKGTAGAVADWSAAAWAEFGGGPMGGGRGEGGEAVEQIGCGAAGEPEDVFAAGNLAEIDADLAEGVGVRAVLAAEGDDARDGAVDGSLQESVVGGEGLQEGGVVAVAREDGDGLAGRAAP